jgi:hypothetical protein
VPPVTALRPRAAVSATPTIRGGLRRARFWLGFAALAVLFVLVALLVRGGNPSAGPPLGADNAAPAGARALVQVLRQHGVTVVPAGTLREARAAADRGGGGGDATVLLFDPAGYLTADRMREVARMGAATVVVTPSFDALTTLAPGVQPAGRAATSSGLSPDCALAAARRAGSITASGQAYRVAPGAAANGAAGTGTAHGAGQRSAVGCFPTGLGAFALAHVPGAHPVDVLGSTNLLRNEGVARAGNAALALNLLGGHHTLVWYLPTLADVPATGPPDLAALTPGWVTPVMLLALATAIAAAVWRGRRFGPLVVERLPVVVRAEETMEGRARLYQRSSARLRALDALRVGAVARLAALAGLPRTASVHEVADAVASLTGRDRAAVRSILLDAVPHSDTELVAGSDRLAELEVAVRAATRPGDGGRTRERPQDDRT